MGSLIIFLLMMLGIHETGIAPFNVPPSAAFLIKLGIPAKPLALIVYFGYGAFWSMLLVYLYEDRTDIKKGLEVALGAWMIMMLVYSPVIGWGVFGFGDAHMLAASDPLYLQSGPKYLVSTLVLHLLFGVSGLLFRNNLIPYDRKTNTNYSQMQMRGVNGAMSGKRLETFQVVQTTWATWKKMFPNAKVLTTDTGFGNRGYQGYLYGENYLDENTPPLFPLSVDDEKILAGRGYKERVYGMIEKTQISKRQMFKYL